MARIMIVDYDEIIRSSLLKLLEKEYEVYGCKDSEQAWQYLVHNRVDLCILDVNLGKDSGYDLCRKIRAGYTIPIIFVTVADDEESLEKGILSGGDDYVTKPFSLKELKLRIMAQLRRVSSTYHDLIVNDGWVVNLSEHSLRGNDQPVEITSVEYTLVQKLIENRGCLITREELIDTIGEEHDTFVEDNTLSVYMSRLRNRMKQTGLKCPIETVRGIGYRWKG